MRCIGVIPARYQSTRFPGKPLASIAGKPMVQHVFERAKQATLLDQVLVATDDDRIRDVAVEFGAKVVMTSAGHASGTDRIAEATEDIDTELVVNIQGDEPLIRAEIIDQAVQPLLDHPEIEMGTLVRRLEAGDLANSNVVKVVFDKHQRALYFSRAAIPHTRNSDEEIPLEKPVYWQHIGLYVYRADFLQQVTRYPQTSLEKAEQLEQLRALEHGHHIHVVITEYNAVAVDTPADLERVRQLFQTTGQKI